MVGDTIHDPYYFRLLVLFYFVLDRNSLRVKSRYWCYLFKIHTVRTCVLTLFPKHVEDK